MTFDFYLLYNTFETTRLILWESNTPFLIISDSSKDFGSQVIIKLIQAGRIEFLRQVLSLVIVLQL